MSQSHVGHFYKLAGILASGDERKLQLAERERNEAGRFRDCWGMLYNRVQPKAQGQSKGMVGGKDKIMGFRHIVLCFGSEEWN